MAERLIRQYEEDNSEERMTKRNELEKEGVRQAFDDCLRAMTINLTQNHGNPHPADLTLQLVIAGILVPIQTSDANGNTVIRYEPRNVADTIAPVQGLGETYRKQILMTPCKTHLIVPGEVSSDQVTKVRIL